MYILVFINTVQNRTDHKSRNYKYCLIVEFDGPSTPISALKKIY